MAKFGPRGSALTVYFEDLDFHQSYAYLKARAACFLADQLVAVVFDTEVLMIKIKEKKNKKKSHFRILLNSQFNSSIFRGEYLSEYFIFSVGSKAELETEVREIQDTGDDQGGNDVYIELRSQKKESFENWSPVEYISKAGLLRAACLEADLFARRDNLRQGGVVEAGMRRQSHDFELKKSSNSDLEEPLNQNALEVMML